MKSRIFVTHSSHDAATATKIRDYLESNGIQCWMAPRDIPIGEEWAKGILNGINTASGMLLVFSSNSNDSSQVRREIERAIHNNIPIYPIRIEDVQPSDAMEYYISSNHWMDTFGGNFETNLDKLVAAIISKHNITLESESEPTSKPIKTKEPSPMLTSQVTDKSSKRKLMFPKLSFKMPKKILFPIAFLFLLITGYFISKSFESPANDTTTAEVLTSLPVEKETFLKEISEYGMNLSCTSIDQTFDGGYLITGRRVAVDTTETWREIWVKKLDFNGNEEWEFSDRDTTRSHSFSRFGTRAVWVTELPDSSFVCAYNISITDTLLPDSMLSNLDRNLIAYETDSLDNEGVGFEIFHITKGGEVVVRKEIRWEKGSWNYCEVTNLLSNEMGEIYPVIRGYNTQYPGSTTLMLYISDIDSLTVDNFNQRYLGKETKIVYIDKYKIMYSVLDYNNRVIYMHEIFEESFQYGEVIPKVENVYVHHFDDRVENLTVPFRIYSDCIICLSIDVVIAEFIYSILLLDNKGSEIYTTEITGIYETILGDLIQLTTEEIVFSGRTTDSVGVTRPYIGMLDTNGEYLWERVIPIEGRAEELDELNNGNLLFAIKKSNDIILLEVDLAGNYNSSKFQSSYYQFVEDWSTAAIDTITWDISWTAGLIEMPGSRAHVLKVNSIHTTPDIEFNTHVLIETGFDLFADIFVANPVNGQDNVQIGLFALNEGSSIVADSLAFASLKWNYGLNERSIVIRSFGSDSSVISDSQYIRYGEWNRFRVSIDSSSVNYFVNNVQLCSEILVDSVFGLDACFQIHGQTNGVPFYVDSIAVRY